MPGKHPCSVVVESLMCFADESTQMKAVITMKIKLPLQSVPGRRRPVAVRPA